MEKILNSYITDRQPKKCILNRFDKSVFYDYEKEGKLTIYFNDINQRPKSIFDSFALFYYLKHNKYISTFNRYGKDKERLDNYIKNIVKITDVILVTKEEIIERTIKELKGGNK